MEKIVWSDRFSLGLSEIDKHHRFLIELLGKTHDGFMKRESDLGGTLKELTDYAEYHFKQEEMWMLEGLYPDIETHKNEHKRFAAMLSELQQPSEAVNYLTMKTIHFLEQWIANHILNADAALGRYLSESWQKMGTRTH
ncbi:hypothetical protein GMLC_19160 [Geomonas limicola]|uniref:Hemerythrin-like domain-containing protein n=1 Tax=Geomonas limicola TaxID=2740186 RepID=A0A6V8N970_9BACT|nr:bacteriohemerythrin [Geomonas limicola]GFO68337.1 hypothetical protein GMLC_19160 [Geomonas limicola]